MTTPFTEKKQNWKHYRIDCVLAIIDQAKFVKNAIDGSKSYEGEASIHRYINELVEMVDTLKRMADEE